MMAVPGLAPPLTRPVEITLAIPGALLVQLPPAVASLKDTEVFTQIGEEPEIADGGAVTVTTSVALTEPQLLVIV